MLSITSKKDDKLCSHNQTITQNNALSQVSPKVPSRLSHLLQSEKAGFGYVQRIAPILYPKR